MNKLLDYFKENCKILFCYLLILLGVLLAVIVFIKKPMKLVSNYVYSSNIESEISEVIFPLEQIIKVHHDNLTNIWIKLEDDSINNYNYRLNLKNHNNDILFENEYINYESNIILISLGLIEDSEDETFQLSIQCDDCQNVNIAKVNTLDDSYIVGDEKNTMKIYYDYYEPNNNFYWYSIMSIVLGFVLIPFSKEKRYE